LYFIVDEPQASELNELYQSPEIQINEKTVDNLNIGKLIKFILLISIL